ncbi:MAG: DNA-J related domain-containing protein [Halorhodospira sp.]
MELESVITDLQVRVEPILHAHPQGITELALMGHLAEEGHALFTSAHRGEPAQLFRAHFLLFHALYRLRPALAEAGLALEIHCLSIRLRPMPSSGVTAGSLTTPDPVAAFYLDPANLEGMDNEAVARLIADGLRRSMGSSDEREAALQELGLGPEASRTEIRRRYRRLAMRHHPDRGGDTAKLQRINAAYRSLMAA